MQRHKAQAWILAVQTDAQRVAKAVSDQHGHVVQKVVTNGNVQLLKFIAKPVGQLVLNHLPAGDHQRPSYQILRPHERQPPQGGILLR